MRKFIHIIIDYLLNILPFSFLQRVARVKLTIPFYHIVSDEVNPLISNLYKYRNVREFEADLDFFQKNYNIINLGTLLKHHEKGTELPKNALLLTFDDGMREMLDVVIPILKKRKIKATFFITTDFLDNKEMFYRNKVSLLISHLKQNNNKIAFAEIEKLFRESEIKGDNTFHKLHNLRFEHSELINQIAELSGLNFQEYLKENRPYLTTEELQQFKNEKFSIGSHSLNHRKYCDTTEAEQVLQTIESTQIIRNKFRLDYGVFAFPFNDQNLSKSFFSEIRKQGNIDLIFSTDGFFDDECKLNYHRFWIESTEETAKQILLRNFKEKFFRILRGRNTITRN